MTAEDLAVLDAEFEAVCARIEPLFYRPESRAHARGYLRGLLAPLEKKNGWVRHEAPCDRVEVRDLHRQAVAAAG